MLKLLVALCLLLIGCPSNYISYYPSPQEIKADGLYSHIKYGFEYPLNIGKFYRSRITDYSTGQENISIGYNGVNPQKQIAITIYRYPYIDEITFKNASKYQINETFEASFNDALNAITSRYDTKTIKNEPYTLEQKERTKTGRIAEILYDHEGIAYKTVLMIFHDGHRLSKVRVTHRNSDKFEYELKEFFRLVDL